MKRYTGQFSQDAPTELAIVDTFTKLIFGEANDYSGQELMIDQQEQRQHGPIGFSKRHKVIEGQGSGGMGDTAQCNESLKEDLGFETAHPVLYLRTVRFIVAVIASFWVVRIKVVMRLLQAAVELIEVLLQRCFVEYGLWYCGLCCGHPTQPKGAQQCGEHSAFSR